MGVFKEEIHFLEDLNKKQVQIWNDSADHGVYASREVKQRMRDVVGTLLELPGSKVVFKQNRPALQRQYKLVVMWGRSYEEWYDATLVDMLYFKGRNKEFFSIRRIGHVLVNKDGKEM